MAKYINRNPLTQLKNPITKEKFISLKAKTSLTGMKLNNMKEKESQIPNRSGLRVAMSR
jgi:hypothetical protein